MKGFLSILGLGGFAQKEGLGDPEPLPGFGLSLPPGVEAVLSSCRMNRHDALQVGPGILFPSLALKGVGPYIWQPC